MSQNRPGDVGRSEMETRTDGKRLALGFAYAREVERACAFVALDAEAQVYRSLKQMDLSQKISASYPHPHQTHKTTIEKDTHRPIHNRVPIHPPHRLGPDRVAERVSQCRAVAHGGEELLEDGGGEALLVRGVEVEGAPGGGAEEREGEGEGPGAL